MDRAAFFAALRKRDSGVFGTSLSQGQVDGVETILNEAVKRRTPRNDLAYKLATTYHETAHTMQPIHERGQRAYFNKYEPGTRIGKVLGNTLAGDGFKYRGRGYVQLTGRSNYHRASKKLGIDLVGSPDLALVPAHAVRILFDGMEEGWFTGKSVRDYIDLVDESDAEDLREFINARRIINGTDRAKDIGDIALAFEAALIDGGYAAQPAPTPASRPSPLPTPAKPVTGKGRGIAGALILIFLAIAGALTGAWQWIASLFS